MIFQKNFIYFWETNEILVVPSMVIGIVIPETDAFPERLLIFSCVSGIPETSSKT
jgi:hypothetical protein